MAMVLLVGGAGYLAGADRLSRLSERWPWRIHDRQEGLLSSNISAIHQDRLAYLYVGSPQGVSRYDLWEWSTLTHSQPFADGEVVRFVESPSALYLATANRFWKVEGGTALRLLYQGSGIRAAQSRRVDETYVIDVGNARQLQVRGDSLEPVDTGVRIPAGTVHDYCIDSGRVHWLATSEGLFARDMSRLAWRPVRDRELDAGLQGSRCVRLFLLEGLPEEYEARETRTRAPAWEELWAYFEDPRGAGSSGILGRLEGGLWRTMARIDGDRIDGLVADGDHYYYATAEDGRLRVSPDGLQWSIVTDLGIGKVPLHAGLVDSSGTVWFRIGTGGIAAFDPLDSRWEMLPLGTTQTYPNVMSLIETEEGDIWVGTTKGLSRIPRDGKPAAYPSVHGIPLEPITGLGEDSQRRIWVASDLAFRGALCFQESTWTRETVPGFSDHPVRRIVRDRLGELWFLSKQTTEAGEHVVYRCSVYTSYGMLPVRLPHGPVNDIVRSRDAVEARDVFWVATDEGLLRGTVEGESFRIDSRYTVEQGLRSDRVFAAAEAPDGSIWICYTGYSAEVTRLKSGIATHYGEADGLASQEVWAIVAKGESLWFGTDRGLSRYDGECWYSYPIASSDPRTSRVLTLFPSRSHGILIGTWGMGAMRFRLDDRPGPKRPRFTRREFPEKVSPSGDVTFRWDARDYRNDTQPESLLFRNRLDRESWTPFGTARSREFRGLSAGTHVFEVEVRDLDGNRNREELVHRFVVERTGAGRTPWVVISASVLLLVLILGFLYGSRIYAGLERGRLYRGFFRRYPAPALIVDGAGRILATSGDISLLPGAPRAADIIGKPLETISVLSSGEVRAAFPEIEAGRELRIETCRFTASDGRERSFEIRGFPLRRGGKSAADGSAESRPQGRSKAWAVIIVEERTRRLEEARLRERDRRLSSLRAFVGRIVTDFERASRPTGGPTGSGAPAAGGLGGVVSGLRLFATRDVDLGARQPVSLNDLLEDRLGRGQRGASAGAEVLRVTGGIRVDYRGQPGLWTVMADPELLGCAILNVLRNAVDSMPESGVLTVRTANVRVEDDPGSLAPGPYVEAVVADTGVGIDPSQIDIVFEPMYSTKARDQAHGVGLSATYGVVRAHGGDIRIDSRPGRGTTVRILLPASRGP